MKVFLSYSRRDDAIATEVRRRLEERGHEIWQDVSSIAGGADWRASIEQGIRAADTFLLILSPQLVRSPKYAREELDFAHKHDKALLPVYAKPVKQLPDGFALTLSGIEYVELFPSFEQGMNELLEVLGDAGTVATAEQVPGLGVWAKGRFGKMKSGARRLRIEAQQRELGRKALRVGSVVAAVAATGAAAAVNAKAAERKSADKRLTEAQQAAQQDYRNRVAGLIANFSQEFSRADEAISPETYQEEFRPRFWNFVGQLEGTVPPTTEFAGPHRDFVRSLRESLVNLDDAFNQLRRDEPERATRSYRRSLEQLFAALEAYTSLLE
jgi:TIR domain